MKPKLLLSCMLVLVCLATSGQRKIVVQKSSQGGAKEIDFSRVKSGIVQTPDPIPGMNSEMKFNQILLMEMISLEGSARLAAYLNSTNGVFGYSGEMMRVDWNGMPNIPENDYLKFFTFLPNGDVFMYTDTPETGKMVFKMGSGISMVSAQFDSWNETQMFWNAARKTGNSYYWPYEKGLLLEEYTVTHDGKVITLWMHDWGLMADHPLARNYVATAFGLGYIYNEKTKHLFYIHEINDGINGIAVTNIIQLDASATKGSYLSTIPFSGKDYKPMGEYLAKELALSNTKLDQDVATEKQQAAEEENAELRRIRMQQAEKMGQVSENIKENNGQFLETSDLADLAKTYTNQENQVSIWQIMELQFQARDEEIKEELSDRDLTTEQRRDLNRQKACLVNQKRVLDSFKSREKAIHKKYEKGDPDDKKPDEMNALYQQYAKETAEACPE